MIKLNKSLSFSEIGKKDNQEDALYPAKTSNEDRVFVLCDGMGGHDKGEVASNAVAFALGNYLSGFMDAGASVDSSVFKKAIETAYDTLDAVFAGDDITGKRPGTTMTCIVVNDNSVLVAHIGDSRIYHIRSGKEAQVLYESVDHSLVNDLILAGELTPEEAESFGHKNIITRAMQPNAKRYQADIYEFFDIRKGDYFFLCSDGVLEHVDTRQLCEILNAKISDAQKMEKILDLCRDKTFDNHTGRLIPVADAKISVKNIPGAIVAKEVKPRKKIFALVRSLFKKILRRCKHSRRYVAKSIRKQEYE